MSRHNQTILSENRIIRQFRPAQSAEACSHAIANWESGTGADNGYLSLPQNLPGFKWLTIVLDAAILLPALSAKRPVQRMPCP